MLLPQTSFHGEISCSIATCRLFSQARLAGVPESRCGDPSLPGRLGCICNREVDFCSVLCQDVDNYQLVHTSACVCRDIEQAGSLESTKEA